MAVGPDAIGYNERVARDATVSRCETEIDSMIKKKPSNATAVLFHASQVNGLDREVWTILAERYERTGWRIGRERTWPEILLMKPTS